MSNISNLYIERYRGIKNLSIDHFERINLIVGDNNCGKTSLLEAIQLMRTSGGLANLYRIARLRDGLEPGNSNSIYENVICMFPADEESMFIKLSGCCDDKPLSFLLTGEQSRVLIDAKDLDFAGARNDRGIAAETETDRFSGTLTISFDEDTKKETIDINRFSRVSGTPVGTKDAFDIIYVAPFEHLKGSIISRIVRNEGYKEICLKALQLFDPDIEDMMIFKSDVGNRPVEYLKHRKLGNMPLSTYGDGIKKVLVLADAIAGAAGGILLIDEIETAIHKKYYDDIFRFIVKACAAFDVQAFVTTHSIEAIDGLLATQDYDTNSDRDDISVVTLKRANDNTYSRTLSGREVYCNREAFGFEVRL